MSYPAKPSTGSKALGIRHGIIAAVCLTFAACSEAPSSNAIGGMEALDACKRSDVQDAVGKEARSMVLKNALPEFAARALFGLVDLDAVGKQFENATVSVSSTALQPGGGADLRTVGCNANFKFDASNAIAGQDVVQIKRLRWTIKFNDDQPDPTSSNFTIEVDQASLYENMAINGEPLKDILDKQTKEEAAKQESVEAAQADPADQSSPPMVTGSEDAPLEQPAPPSKPASQEELYAPQIQ